MATPPSLSAAGLLGKAPCQADFIRINAQDPVCQQFHRWLEEAMDLLRNAGNPSWTGPLYFLFSPPQGAKSALLGALAPSCDQVGRQFPLSVFAPISGAGLAQSFSALPIASQGFLSGAAQILADAPRLSAQEFAERVRQLPLPSGGDFGAADQALDQRFAQHKGAELLEALGVRAEEDAAYYPFRTFAAACTAEPAPPPKANITVDCPLPAEVGPAFWLELARRLLKWREAPPSLLWTDSATPRLLISLGPAPSAALLYWVKPDPKATRLWPLRTSAPSAIAAAKQALSAEQRRWISQPDSTLQQLLVSLSS